MKYCYINKHFI